MAIVHRCRLTSLCRGMFLSLVLTLTLGSAAAAQDQTPRELPFTPDSEFCTVEPRTVDELTVLSATPTLGTPEVATPDTGTPAGEEADEETVGAVTATVIEAIACINGGEIFRFLSLVTDDALPVLTGGTPLNPEALAALSDIAGTPFPEDQWTTLIDVRNVRVEDGRVSAIVETSTTGQPGQVDLFYFAEEEGRYLIDGIVENVAASSGTPATLSWRNAS